MPKRTDIKRILVIGSGPIVIGQACEFDYSGTQACKALRAEGYDVVLVNSNPATIMTDPGMADHTYIEPLTVDRITAVIEKERPDALLPNLGGQTALNCGVQLYRSGVLPCNVAMIQVSPPDAHGYVSLGTSVDATLAAVECAQTVIAVINKHVPRSFGDAFIHVDDIDLFVQDDTPLEEAHFSEPNEVETAIGKHCAALIEDGACLQMGIGAIPNAVLAQLGGHKNLGIHTEMFADGVLPLVESGVINGRNKAIDKGKMVSTFLMGSQKVYDFIDNNPGVAMMDVGYTNDPFVIAKNPKVTAINSALQVDLTGQICADSLGTKFYSGVGGQIDFIYGASRSEGGKAILAMPSTTNKGISKIAPELTLGAGVVTTRSHVHWFVTEYGAVNLYGRSLQERARLIISVAHPDHQETLDRAAFERYGEHHHYIKATTSVKK